MLRSPPVAGMTNLGQLPRRSSLVDRGPRLDSLTADRACRDHRSPRC